MEAVHALLPGAPETLTGGFVYDHQMLQALQRAGRLASLIVLPGAWPTPALETVAAADRAVAALPDRSTLLVDGLAFSPLLEVFEHAQQRITLIALIHHPLADETGLDRATRDRLFERECRALALAHGIVVTSVTTGRRLTDFAVPADRVRVVRPGVHGIRAGNWAAMAKRRRNASRLLCVASLTPRKGQDVLLRALARHRHLPWRLRLVGPERDRAFAASLRRLARALGLKHRIAMIGAVAPADLPAEYRAADLFVLPSHHEGFGMVVAEAAAYGLPIVASDAGAIAEAAEGSRHQLVPPGDPRRLAAALLPHLSRKQGRSKRPRERIRSWDDAGREFLAALDAFGAP